MRRRIIIGVVILIGVIVLIRGLGPARKTTKQAPLQRSEVVFNNTLQLKDSDSQQAKEAFEGIVSEFPQSVEAQKALLEIAGIYRKEGDTALEKETLQRLIKKYEKGESVAEAADRLGNINIAELFSPELTDDSFMYTVQPGDTLYKIAKENKTTVDLLMKSNNLTKSLIRPGMKLKIAKSVFSIEVSKAKKELTLKAEGEVLKRYPVGLGENNGTPVGQFKITNRIIDPVWYKTGAIVPSGSPENILGTRWLGLSEPGYGIHGTTDKSPVQEQQTQGCVRMRNEDVEELFAIVPVGTQVRITD